jgi:hypothetical protein
MSGRSRRRLGFIEIEVEDGPFVSFTDLFIGILFLFLILVAALMLMHQEAVKLEGAGAQRISERIQLLQAKLETRAKLDADHAPFRLAIVFNVYQAPAYDGAEWTFSRTVQVYRSANGLCLNNVIVQNNLSLDWKPSIEADDIPTADNQAYVRMGVPCTLSASGEQWDLVSETGGVERKSANLYEGVSVLHSHGREKTLKIQYRVLGVYDGYFRKPQGAARRSP